MLGLPSGVTGDQDNAANGLAVDPCDVVLEEAVDAVGAGETELLVRTSPRGHDRDDELRSGGLPVTLSTRRRRTRRRPMPTLSKRPGAIVLVHGFWVTPR